MKDCVCRISETSRKTSETDIYLKLNIDGKGISQIDTGIAFLDHMLELFSKHGSFDLELKAKGDIEVDYHHTIEDIGIVIGESLKKALGNKRGINRYGFFVLPMDEALVMASLDLSGRPFLSFDVKMPSESINGIATRLFHEFFYALSMNADMTLHVRMLSGDDDHHIVEAVFKSFAKALRTAVQRSGDLDSIPSTKGML